MQETALRLKHAPPLQAKLEVANPLFQAHCTMERKHAESWSSSLLWV